MPVWTICTPQISSATAPARSIKVSVASMPFALGCYRVYAVSTTSLLSCSVFEQIMNGGQCDTSVDAGAAPSRAAVSGTGTDRGATRGAGPPVRNHAWLARRDLRAGRLDVSPRRTIGHRQRCHRVLLRRPCFRARVCRPILLRLSGRDDRRRFCDPRRHAATPPRRPRPQDPLTRRSRRLTDLTNLADWVGLAATTFAAALLYAVSGYGFAVLATPLYLLLVDP